MSDLFLSPIFVRAYTEKTGQKPLASKGSGPRLDEPSPWTLVFDTGDHS
jgi:hypothetical protein